MKRARVMEIRMNERYKRVWRVAKHAGLFLTAWGFSQAGTGHAQELPQDFDLAGATIQKAPTLIKFQARVSQGLQPIGNASFTNVYVSLLDSTGGKSCTEQFSNVEVRSSVLNLTIGRNQADGCDLDEFIRQASELSFKVCLESQTTCLKPIQVGSVPFATKATFAHQAVEANRADVAAQSHYTHRATSSASMLSGDGVAEGYFDFHTPDDAGFLADDEFTPYEDGGFLQWTPVRTTAGEGAPATLNICAKERFADGSEGAARLDELVLLSDKTTMRGSAEVADGMTCGNSSGTGLGLTVTEGGKVTGGLNVSQGSAGVGLEVNGSAGVSGGLWVSRSGPPAMGGAYGLSVADGGVGVQSGGIDVQAGGVTVQSGGAAIAGGLVVSGGSSNTLDVQGSAHVSNGVVVENGAGESALQVSGPASFDNSLVVQDGGGLTCRGDAAFSKNTTIGSSASVNASTLDVYAASTHHGDVHLNGQVTTAQPIPGVVAPNDITTAHIQDAAVTNAKLGLQTADPDLNSGYRFCAGTGVSHTLEGNWTFCALTEMQVADGGGRCKVYRNGSDWALLLVSTDAANDVCCSVNCF